jgi:hypothetical protein
MRKEPYHCPHCHQTCSRHWNLKVHIQRKHGWIGQQPIASVSLSNRAEFIPSTSNLGTNGRYLHHQEASPDYVHHPSELYSDKLEESSRLPLLLSPPTSKEKDASDKLLKTIAEAVEFKKMLSKQLQSFSSPSTNSFLEQLPGTVALTMSSLLSGIKTAVAPNLVNYNHALQFCNVLMSNRNVGFRGHICFNCFECWVDLLHSNSEQQIKSLINSTNSSIHTCNLKKVTDAYQNAQGIQSKKDELLQNVLTDLLVFLIIICWFCFGQNKIYLKTEELTDPPPPTLSSSSSSSHLAFDLLQRQNYNHLPRVNNNDSTSIEQGLRSQQQQYPSSSFRIEEEEQERIENNNCNSIHIDLTKVEEKHWAYRAINEALDDGKSSIEIDSGELIDFVNRARATFGIHVTDIGESIRHFFYVFII